MNSKLGQLTFTRFLAALIVIFFHFGAGIKFIDGEIWSSFIRAGSTAVSYFFVLSGFIMAYVYSDLKPEDRGSYWLARIARIYPVYLLAILVSLPTLALTPFAAASEQPGALALNLLLLQAWVPGYEMTFNPPGWSLSVEMFFYAVFPALIVQARRIGPVRFCLVAAVFWLVSQVAVNTLAASRWPHVIHYFPLFHLNAFVIGMATGLLAKHLPISIFAKGSAVACAAISGLTIAYFTLLKPSGVVLVQHVGLLAPMFAAWAAALFAAPLRLLAAAPLRALGESSYALYILQMPVSAILGVYFFPYAKLSLDARFWIFLGVLTALSFATFFILETPARNAIKRAAGTVRSYLARPA